MLLVMDVGNTNTVLGVYDGARLLVSWRLTSRREQTSDEYGVFTQTLLKTRGIEPAAVTAVALSTVVPPVHQILEEMCVKYFGIHPFVVEPGVNVAMPILLENPREVGPDRIVNAVAAVALYGVPLIIVDFGTATTLDCISPRGEFLGGAIAPGITTAAEALFAKAARLFRVELVFPQEVIGRSTVAAIQSGLLYGYAGLVDGMVDRMRAEMAGDPVVVATGGLAGLIHKAARTIQHVNVDLTLEGLRLIYEHAHP
jgi:type III pantothenate kinase